MNHKPKKRVLIIGLDGFTWRVGNRLIQKGYMPQLSFLRQNGAYGNLRSIIPFETSPAWTSFQTGCLPPKTGIFAFHSIDADYNKIHLNSFDKIQVPSIWEIASTAGKKLVSINLPMTSPPPKINGIIIPGLTCPSLSPETVYPREVYDTYVRRYPDYRIVNKEQQDSLEDYVTAAVKTEQARCELCLQLLSEKEWDIFCVEMQSTDFFQHRNWWALDPDASGHTPEAFDTAAVFYHKIDTMVSKLIEAAGKDTLVVIVSDHGFDKIRAELSVNSWLSKKGYLTLINKKTSFSEIKKTIKNKVPLVKKATRFLGQKLKSNFTSQEKDAALHAERIMRHIREIIDLKHTSAFCLGGVSALLYVNPHHPNHGEEITRMLLDEYGPDSHDPYIEKICRVDEIYDIRDNNAFLPEYVILLDKGVAHHIQPDGEIIIPCDVSDKQGGTHDVNGVFIFSGNGIKANTQLNASLIDITPTLLAFLNIPVPNHMDGKVLQELFNEQLNPVYTDYKSTAKNGNTLSYSDEEQALVEKQLKDLGYL